MPVFALVDCNNFYVSCERLFAPRLLGRPVVVLSNNDSCIIARSPEAKALGFVMGEPEFKVRSRLKEHGVAVFSSNYALYGDLSARVMATLATFTPSMEVYSIDEAFLNLRGIQEDLLEYAERIRKTVHQWTGIPVSIGIGPTKTLAKAANRLAKQLPGYDGVLDLTAQPNRDRVLGALDVEDVWGIGRRHAKRLKDRGVTTALDFLNLSREWVLKNMTVVGLHTWLELKGVPCIVMDDVAANRKSIVCSRSFGHAVTTLEDLGEAMARHASRAGEKLREQGGQANTLQVFVQTNTFDENEPKHFPSVSMALVPPTSNTLEIVGRARKALEQLFRPGLRYKKIGIMLSGIESESSAQLSLLPTQGGGGSKLMEVLDQVNAKWGRETLSLAASGIERTWSMKQVHRSPRYTTVWNELPTAKL